MSKIRADRQRRAKEVAKRLKNKKYLYLFDPGELTQRNGEPFDMIKAISDRVLKKHGKEKLDALKFVVFVDQPAGSRHQGVTYVTKTEFFGQIILKDPDAFTYLNFSGLAEPKKKKEEGYDSWLKKLLSRSDASSYVGNLMISFSITRRAQNKYYVEEFQMICDEGEEIGLIPLDGSEREDYVTLDVVSWEESNDFWIAYEEEAMSTAQGQLELFNKSRKCTWREIHEMLGLSKSQASGWRKQNLSLQLMQTRTRHVLQFLQKEGWPN